MKRAIRVVVPIIAVLALVQVFGQTPAPISLDSLMATPFPTDLVAAPTGGRFAWVSSNSGVHNILVADPTPMTSGALAGPGEPATGAEGVDGRVIRLRSPGQCAQSCA